MSDLAELMLRDHISVLSGFPFASENFSDRHGIPLIRIRDLLSDTVGTFYNGPYLDEFVITNGDVLIGMDGDFNVVRWSKGRALLNQRVCKVQASSRDLDQGFLFWLLEPELLRIHRRTPQTTVRHLSTKDLYAIKAIVPPAIEQEKVAQILDTLDTQIRQTKALIAKLERIKQGLLTDLLTRGIDENGQLRPAPDQAPQLYKDSTLGKIPRKWDVLALRECTQKIADRDHTTPVYFESGVRMISPTNLTSYEGIDFDGCKRITRRAHEINRKKTDLEPGDLVIHRIGAGLGRVRLVTADMPEFSILHSMAQIRPDDRKITSEYLLWSLRIDSTLRQMGLGTQSIGVPDLGLDKIGELQIPVAPVPEQRQIVDQLRVLVERLADESSVLGQLVNLKIGLMDDLLTGKVRVNSLLDSTELAFG